MFFDNENTLISRFERTVQAFPDHIAVDDAKREITFCELREEALRLKACIPKELGARSPQPIGIFLEESVEAVAAIVRNPDDATSVDVQIDDGRVSKRYSSSSGKVSLEDWWDTLWPEVNTDASAFTVRPHFVPDRGPW